jgi:sodium-coupled neutral amino acid transporter 11
MGFVGPTASAMSPSPRLAVLLLLASNCHGILALDKVSLPRGAPQRPALRSVAPGARVPYAPRLSAAAAAATKPPSGGASVPSTIANLAKNIVGSGVLALAAGVGAFSGAKVGIIPALVLLLIMCGLSGYTFSTIARVSAAVGASSYRDAWSKVFGERSAAFPNAAIVFKTFVGCLAYAIILGDSAASMASLAGGSGALASPNVWIGLISSFILLPLCLLRDLSSLSIGSIIGTLGTSYTAIFMTIRCLDGSYAPGGLRAAPVLKGVPPAFSAPTGTLGGLNLKALVLVSMLATTFLAHYNAPKFYTELAAPKSGVRG